MSYQLIHGSAHDIPIADKSVHAIMTSPPYYGLRAYSGEQAIEWPTVEYAPMAGLAPIRVQGCEPGCQHEWADGPVIASGRNDGGEKRPGFHGQASGYGGQRKAIQGSYCIRCGGWRGGLGLEPTIEMYIGHLILCLREWHRVLRDDGTCWVNLGSSYNGSGGAGGDYGPGGLKEGQPKYPGRRINGLKPKDLILVMDRFANAAQADGWYIRSRPPWIKKNSMPESVTDRPSTSHEEWVMMTKSENYFWDIEAIKMPNAWPDHNRFGNKDAGARLVKELTGNMRPDAPQETNRTGRNRRTGDWYYESLDVAISEVETWLSHAKQVRKTGGLLLGVDGDPAAFLVNPRPYKEAHFATFPQQMIEPIIRGATSQHGVCAQCGAPWKRVVERGERIQAHWDNTEQTKAVIAKGKHGASSVINTGSYQTYHTTGWQPTCQCQCDEVIPATIIDPFVGSGTTLRAAMKLGRNAIGVDISDSYLGDLVPERASNVQMEMAL